MRVVALVSGGKDSCFNMMHCVAQGHTIVALANLKPNESQDEMDSYMYQTVGHHVIDLYAEAMNLPLFRATIHGAALCTKSNYDQQQGDEVEDLYQLLATVKEKVPYDGVSSGAILSNYQRVRVENVCSRLGVQSLAYLWQRDQPELLNEMIHAQVHSILIKVATLGLEEKHLGKSLSEMQEHLEAMNKKFGLNPCGEGGEYETMTLDCPLFNKKIVIDEQEVIVHSDDAFAPVAYISFTKMHLEDKIKITNLQQILKDIKVNVPTFSYDSIEQVKIVDSPVNKKTTDDFNMKHEPSMKTCESRGWLGEVVCQVGDGLSIDESVASTLNQLNDLLVSCDFSLEDISLVHIYCSNMAHFSQINAVYKQYFKCNPPARVCVELPLPSNVVFKLDACLHKVNHVTKENLHVQSISYWAPANIGPYSQAVKINGRQSYFSGSIGMIPSSLNVIQNDFIQEAFLSLHHVNEVHKVLLPNINIEQCCGHLTCYVTHTKYFQTVQDMFRKQNMFPCDTYSLNIVAVPQLPKQAHVEWHLISINNNEKETGDEDGVSTDGSGDEGEDDLTASFHSSTSVISINRQDVKNVKEKLKDIFQRNTKANFIKIFYKNTRFQYGEIYQVVMSTLIECFKYAPAISLLPVTAVYPITDIVTVLIVK